MSITPTIKVEIAMATYDPSTIEYFILDLDVLDGDATLGPNETFADVSAYVRSVQCRRGRQRSTDTFAAGTATVVLDNRDGRFDPSNTSGPYAAGGISGVVPMRPVRISATYSGVEYRLFTGFIDSWAFEYAPSLSDATATIACSDGLKLLSATNGRLAQVAAEQNAANAAATVVVTTDQANTSSNGYTIVTTPGGRARVIETI